MRLPTGHGAFVDNGDGDIKPLETGEARRKDEEQ
jgi:hypothetical protein